MTMRHTWLYRDGGALGADAPRSSRPLMVRPEHLGMRAIPGLKPAPSAAKKAAAVVPRPAAPRNPSGAAAAAAAARLSAQAAAEAAAEPSPLEFLCDAVQAAEL